MKTSTQYYSHRNGNEAVLWYFLIILIYYFLYWTLQKFFRKKPPKELLPTKPIDTVTIDAWWMVNIGYITEDDIRVNNIIVIHSDKQSFGEGTEVTLVL